MAGLTTTGYQSYTANELLVLVNDVFIETFGSVVSNSLTNTIDENPSTLIGALSQQLTLLIIDFQANLVYLYAQVYNLNNANGSFLDGLGAWQNITRTSATYSLALSTVFGAAGTVLPIASGSTYTINTDGDLFLLTSYSTNGGVNYVTTDLTIPSTGSQSYCQFIATTSGEIDYSTANLISTNISGWESVTVDSGTLGTTQESDTNYRNTIKYAQGINSTAALQSLSSLLYGNSDVTQFYILENTTDSTITNQSIVDGINYGPPLGVTVNAHSIFVSIFGSISNNTIAEYIFNKKAGGCGMNGNTTYIYTPVSPITNLYPVGYSVPITFNLAIQRNIYVNIIISSSVVYSTFINKEIAIACVNNWYSGFSINGTVQQYPVNMGAIIYANRFYPSIQALGIYNIYNIYMCPTVDYATLTQQTLFPSGTTSSPFIFDGQPLTDGNHWIALMNQGNSGSGDNNSNNGIYLLTLSTTSTTVTYTYTRASDVNLVSTLNGDQIYVINATDTVSAKKQYSVSATGTADSFTTVIFTDISSSGINSTTVALAIDQAASLTSDYIQVSTI